MKEADLGWLAGFFEAEGSATTIRQRNKGDGTMRYYLRVTVPQKDRRPLDRFARLVGVPKQRVKHERKNLHRLAITGPDAWRVLRLILPHVGQPKRRQAETAMSWCRPPELGRRDGRPQ
jgi:hypothetical protein